MRCETKRKEFGFTLIEVLIAIVILSVGLLSLAQMMVFATRSNALAGRMTSSAALAREQLERLKAVPFYSNPAIRARSPLLLDGGDVEAGGDNNYVQFYDADSQPVPDGSGLYEVRWEITSVVAPGLPLEMLEIRVRCLPAAGMSSQFAIIGEARFTTYRTASVG